VANAPADLAVKLETAEGMIDAFYSFDATKLQPRFNIHKK